MNLLWSAETATVWLPESSKGEIVRSVLLFLFRKNPQRVLMRWAHDVEFIFNVWTHVDLSN